MVAINLLDWRSRHILILNRRFIVIVGVSVIATLLLAGFVYLIIEMQIKTAKSSIAYLDSQLTDVSGTITEIKKIQDQKNSLIEKQKTIEALQANRPMVVQIFDSFARIVPAGVVLNQLSRKGDKIVLAGNSDSNYNVSVLMDNAQHLPWVKSAKLGQLKSSDQSSTAEAVGFEIDLTLNDAMAGTENAATGN